MSNYIEKIDGARLRPLVRRALRSDTAEILRWNRQQIKAGIGGGLGGTAIYLFEGWAQANDEQVPWSLILKVLEARKEEAPDSSHYWKREAEVYRSRWLESLPGPLVAPRCFGVEEFADEGCWLWLEHVVDDVEDPWPLAHYGVVANHLGQFSGANAIPTASPSWPWLSSKFIRDDVEHAAANIDRMRRYSSHPLVHRVLPGNSRDDLFQLFDQRETLLGSLEKLPQVLCHFDAFRSNLFGQRNQDGLVSTVAIDWAFVGSGPIGAEIVALVLVALVAGQVEWSRAWELDTVFLPATWRDYVRPAGAAIQCRFAWPIQPRLPCDGLAYMVTYRLLTIYNSPREMKSMTLISSNSWTVWPGLDCLPRIWHARLWHWFMRLVSLKTIDPARNQEVGSC